MRKILFLTPLLILYLAAPRIATAAEVCPTFGGRATVVQANVLGVLPTVLSDTGDVDTTGGAKQASLLTGAVAGLLTADDLHATVVAGGNSSRAEASISNLNLTVAGNTIGADFIMARANASCASAGPTLRGFVEIDALRVNGQSVAVTGFPNQVVTLFGGLFMILNEQTSSIDGISASITVNAVHVSGPGVDIVIGADPVIRVGVTPFIVIMNPGCDPTTVTNDFVTGGGWINAPPPINTAPSTSNKGTFGVGGGCKHGELWGHLEYHDHGAGLNVHGTQVTGYLVTGPTSRRIFGNARVNGMDGFTCIVDVADDGEPSNSGHPSTSDCFSIEIVETGYTAACPVQGGGIQLHPMH